MAILKHLVPGLLVGSCLGFAGMAAAQSDARARVHMRPEEHRQQVSHVDGFNHMPPDVRARATPGVAARVNPFRAHPGSRLSRFGSPQRAAWTHGHWWHGRRGGRLGWWWWADGGWFFYDTPAYPYP